MLLTIVTNSPMFGSSRDIAGIVENHFPDKFEISDGLFVLRCFEYDFGDHIFQCIFLSLSRR